MRGFLKKTNIQSVVFFRVIKLIESLYRKSSYVESVRAISDNKCNRCLGTNIYKDNYGLYHCLDCYDYGEINEEMFIYRSVRQVPHKQHLIDVDYELTDLQMKGSDFFVGCYETKQSAFLQAVCGAGKTEMTFQVILNALNKQAKICFVLPRVEVLKELAKRFVSHFPNTNIAVMYEGHKNYNNASFILSTPQQLIYFFQEFDFIIVDEVDAFPYENNPFLQRLVQKSLKLDGLIFYMSATIKEEFQTKINQKEIAYCLIPARYHLKGLPIPKCIRIKNSKNPYNELIQYLEINQKKNQQCLIFVSSIKEGKQFSKYLSNRQIQNKFLFSESIDKRTIIKQFRNKEYLFLITTTVLERGVTFEDIDCYVFRANNRIFSKQSLIQISGRVGRKLEYHLGKVIFFSEYISKDMKAAAKEILLMNRKHQDAM